MVPLFIYVFTQEDKEKMLAKGYRLVNTNPNGAAFVFENKPGERFESENMKYVYSNSLVL